MPVLTAPLVILGQVVAAAFAAGLNLYLVVAVVGVSARLGLIPDLPPGLKGLENSILILSAVLLYLVEFIVDKVPYLDSVWDALHTIIRPLGAALLTALALNGASLELQIGAAVIAGMVALASHASKAGFRILLNTAPSKWRSGSTSTLEDILAASLTVLALSFPVAALTVAAGGAAFVILLGPRLWRAGVLGVRALRARQRAFFGFRGWRSIGDLPGSLRPLVEPSPAGQAQPRAARVAVKGIPGVAAYRNGWLVVTNNGVSFVYRARFRARVLHLPPVRQPEIRHGPWTDAVDFRVNGKRRCTLFLLKDGPAPETALADLHTVP